MAKNAHADCGQNPALIATGRSTVFILVAGCASSAGRYQYKYGKPRPAYLWDKGEHGWCDCGQPATRTVDVRIYRKIEKMPVCESCYAEEMRQQKWYGGATQNQEGVNQQHSTR